MEQNILQSELERIRATSDVIDLIDTNFHKNGFQFPAATISSAMDRYLSERRYDPDPRGAAPARESIRGYYASHGVDVDASNIIITASSSESYSLLFNNLCAPGDTIALPRPGYPLFEYLAGFSHLEPRYYDLDAGHGFRIDADSIRAAIGPRTRFVVVISPNNPTGRIAGDDELLDVLRLCEEFRLMLIVDEVFSEFRYSDGSGELPRAAALAAAREIDVPVFTLNGISKMFASPDLKLGWIAAIGPAEDIDPAIEKLEIANDMFLNANSFTQFLLPDLFRDARPFQEAMIARIDGNRRRLVMALSRLPGLRFVEPNGGIHCTVALTGDGPVASRFTDDEELALALLRGQRVYVHPGYFYGLDESPGAEISFVMSFLKEPESFEKGLERLAAFLSGDGLGA